MGLFYTTFTTRGPDADAVQSALKKLRRSAFVSPTVEEYTVIYDQKTEEQDFPEIEKLGMALSEALRAPVLAAALHDDDVLYLWLFQNGEKTDFYNSLPAYFDADAEAGPPEGGNARLLCEAFGCPQKIKRVEELLRANLLDGELPEIAGELERHDALTEQLGLPAYASTLTYSGIKNDYVPEEFGDIEFKKIVSRSRS
jgi:hypothetical protein